MKFEEQQDPSLPSTSGWAGLISNAPNDCVSGMCSKHCQAAFAVPKVKIVGAERVPAVRRMLSHAIDPAPKQRPHHTVRDPRLSGCFITGT